jgi:hypothetical protein
VSVRSLLAVYLEQRILTVALLPLARRRRLASRLITLSRGSGRRVVVAFGLALPAATELVLDNSPLIASVLGSFDVGGASDGLPVGLR